jgi:hypothetical protein
MTTRVDERPPAVRTRAEALALLDLHNAERMVRIARETETTPATLTPRHELTKPGDEQAARGVPILGFPGTSGAIAGTRP